MLARWGVTCAKCSTHIEKGEPIKAQYKRVGYEDGKPVWQRVPKAYVHAPRCPKVTPNKPGQKVWDPQTGELLVAQSATTSQGSIFDD